LSTSWIPKHLICRRYETALLIEQAFMNLPEILTGSGYPTQDYEGGIVAAYTLALLQELNGRNVNNPISAVQLERPFRSRKEPLETSSGEPRYFRCDVYVDGSKVKMGSRLLATYGWRHSNWIETKFFRQFTPEGVPKASTGKDINKGALLADLVRLLTLVPKTVSPKAPDTDICGRYLLHIYSRKPGDHLSLSYNQGGGGTRIERTWLKGLLGVGQQSVESFKLATEVQTVREKCGVGLDPLVISYNSTNFVLQPRPIQNASRSYHCVLSRIDSFKLGNGDDEVSSSLERLIKESSVGALERIVKFVATHLGIKSGADEEEPEDDDDVAVAGGAAPTAGSPAVGS
jgi:hypothetical protein